jgi:hypothetical protein
MDALHQGHSKNPQYAFPRPKRQVHREGVSVQNGSENPFPSRAAQVFYGIADNALTEFCVRRLLVMEVTTMRSQSPGLWSILLAVIMAGACTQYKPSAGRTQFGDTTPVVANVIAGPAADVTLVLANTKLIGASSPLTASILYANQSLTQEFTPTGAQTTLAPVRLPMSATGVLTIEIRQNNVLRFVAKKANPNLQANNRLVIDDCLILRAPWSGTVNESSCEWTISEVN